MIVSPHTLQYLFQSLFCFAWLNISIKNKWTLRASALAEAVLRSTRESWRWFAHKISLHQHIANPPEERMKIGLMNHVSFNFRRWIREKSSRKMKCHQLEVYGLLDSNKIYIFLSFCRLGDGDRSEKDRHSPWNIKKHFRFRIDTSWNFRWKFHPAGPLKILACSATIFHSPKRVDKIVFLSWNGKEILFDY